MKAYEKNVKLMIDAIENVKWADPKIYAAFLAQTYMYTQHTTRILALAGANFDFANQLAHKRFLKHVSEEMAHEKLADRDIVALGFKLEDFEISPAIRAFFQVQYYYIEHRSPWAIMGYVLALEGLAAQAGHWLAEKVAESHAPETISFLRLHADEDEGHVEKAFRIIEGQPDHIIRDIEEAMDVMTYLYIAMLRDLDEIAKKSKQPIARKSVA